MNQHFHNSKNDRNYDRQYKTVAMGSSLMGLLNDSDNELVSEIITVTISVSVITTE